MSPPPFEQFQGACCIADFIAKIIRPAAITVNVEEILMQTLGKQKADYLKVFVVTSSERFGVPAGSVERPRGEVRSVDFKKLDRLNAEQFSSVVCERDGARRSSILKKV